MADEEKQTGEAVASTTEVVENEVPKAFGEAQDKIDEENKVVETPIEQSTDETPAVGETEESTEETVETPKDEDAPVGDKTEGPDALADVDPEALEYLRNYYGDDNKVAQAIKLKPDLPDDIQAVLDEDKTPVEEEKQKKAEQVLDELKFNLDPDIVGADVKAAIDKMAGVLNEQRKGLGDERSQLQAERDSAFNARIDGQFDRLSKNVPDLGNAAKLSRKEYQLRSELFAHANVTVALRKVPIERALEIEVNKFKNQGGEKAAEQKVIDKLNKQKTRMTNRPTRRTNKAGRKFRDEWEEQEYKMAQAEEKAGLA